jgi:hypothetical protein
MVSGTYWSEPDARRMSQPAQSDSVVVKARPGGEVWRRALPPADPQSRLYYFGYVVNKPAEMGRIR